MNKFLVLLVLSLLVAGFAWADVIHSDNCAAATSGWTFTNGGGVAVQQSGYWLVDHTGDAIISQAFDVSAFTDLTLTFKVGTYGSGTNHAAKVEYSTDNGSNWNASTFTSATPTSSTMISAGTWSLGTINSGQFKLRWTSPDGGSKGVRLDDILLSGTPAANTPLITLSTSSLSGFNYEYLTGPSEEQTFTVSGSDLTADISIAATTNYEISKTSGSGYTSPLTFTQTGGVVSTQTVYVRLKSGLSIGNYINEDINATSSGATTKSVTCGGSVSSPPPPNAPVAIDATAISHEGFTARWNAVSGATSYRIDVFEGAAATNASDLIISEYIEGSSNNKAIEIYNGTGSSVDLSQYTLQKQTNGVGSWGGTLPALSGYLAHGDVYVIAHSSATSTILALADMTYGTSPMDFNGNDAVGLFKNSVQIDQVGIFDDPNVWGADMTLVRKSSITAPTTSYSISDWDSYASNTITYLGSHTMGSTPVFVTGWNNKAVNSTVVRVGSLDSETDYTYRVRAVNDYGTSVNSNIIEVTTAVESIGEGASTTINGATFTIKVLPLDGFTTNSVEIDPASTTSDDISMTVIQYTGSIKYSFTGNNAALNGLYWINHAGLGYIPFDVTVNDGTIIEWMSDANETFVEISDFGAKGTLEITLHEEDTLPVELSSFSAVINAYNKVNLLWVTQTETNLTGYYIYRSNNDEIANATQISALINPTNTSTQQQYIYTDGSLTEDGMYYYWLQVAEMDGSSAFHGPTTVTFSGQSGPGTPDIPLLTEISNVYPNPFNPSTTISYSLAKTADVSFTIYNSRGQVVRNFNKGTQTANTYKLSWNGKDNYGSECSTGVYFIKMNAGKDSFVRKAVLMK
jgi:hypothetical protein